MMKQFCRIRGSTTRYRMMQIHRYDKAISNVLSSILMIIVVVTGMTILFNYVAVYSGNYQRGQGSSVMELIQVEDVWKKTSRIDICFYNYGKIPVIINSVYVNDHLSDFTLNSVYHDDTLIVSNEIPIGAHGNVTVTPDY
ncbi:MAG: Type pilin, partial [Thermoproteota archaeon]|nr:Type pilin [Thermoproteota archaeon]